jgi:gas vesicle protein
MAKFDGSTSVVTFLLGLGVGALTALLFAPKAGDELRGDIADGVNDRVNQARNTVNSTVKKISKHAQSVVDDANDRIQDAVEAGQNAYAAAAAKKS